MNLHTIYVKNLFSKIYIWKEKNLLSGNKHFCSKRIKNVNQKSRIFRITVTLGEGKVQSRVQLYNVSFLWL